MQVSVLWPSLILNSLVVLCQSQQMPSYLTATDYANAAFVDTSQPMKILLNDQHFHAKRFRRGSVVSFETDKWPNGRVPYILSSAYTPVQRAILARSMAAYSTKTCIRFVPKEPNDRDYIVISKLDGCYADFARVGGRQQVSLADECIDYATIIHELMHVIGFIHEHQRDDRDSFVEIKWKNVIDGANADFDKISSVGLSNYGESYDYFSIMHYEATEGSKNGKNTIESKTPGFTPLMGKSTDFTRADLTRINKAYKCFTGSNSIVRQRVMMAQQRHY
ncbi:Metalloendopeptidase [Aphelenchoides bicaudatus]|nr:Metalloendopeptidase [Aphelenchoides bicaudatus]